MLHKTFFRCLLLAICTCKSVIAERALPNDLIILINGDTLKGQIKQMSDLGMMTFVGEQTSLERLMDSRFVNLAILSSGKIFYKRKIQVRDYASITDGQCAVFPYSKERQNSIDLIFPDMVKRSVVTNYNNELNRSEPELYELPVDQIPTQHRKLKKVFDGFAYANAATICLVEPTDGSKVVWHFYSKPVSQQRVESMLANNSFELIEEHSFRIGDLEVSDFKVPFIMKFSSNDSCTFIQNGKTRILKYRVISPSSIGFTTYGRRNDIETIYDIVYLSGSVLRYSIVNHGNGGFLTRAVRRKIN